MNRFFSLIIIAIICLGFSQSKQQNLNPFHLYTNVDGDTLNLGKDFGRYKALLFINSRSCTGCKDELAVIANSKTGYEWWIISRCGISSGYRRENRWFYKGIFGKGIKDVVFDNQTNNEMPNEPAQEGNYKYYNITITPSLVIIDTKLKRELFIPYDSLFSDNVLSPKLSETMANFKKGS